MNAQRPQCRVRESTRYSGRGSWAVKSRMCHRRLSNHFWVRWVYSRAALAVVTRTPREAPGISSHSTTGRSLCEETWLPAIRETGFSLGKGGVPGLGEWPGCQKNLRLWDMHSQTGQMNDFFQAHFCRQWVPGFCLWAVLSLRMQMSLAPTPHALPCSQVPSPTTRTGPLPYPAKPPLQLREPWSDMPSATSSCQVLSLTPDAFPVGKDHVLHLQSPGS